MLCFFKNNMYLYFFFSFSEYTKSVSWMLANRGQLKTNVVIMMSKHLRNADVLYNSFTILLLLSINKF